MDRVNIANYIKSSVLNNTLRIEFQPQFCFHDGAFTVEGVEALLRPDKTICHVDRFVKVAVETGLMTEVGYWILKTSLNQLRKWLDEKLVTSYFTMSINITGQQLQDKNFTSKVLKIIEETEVQPHQVILEITETSLVDDSNIVKIYQLSKEGVNISLDDFGTGYSSLGRLKILPIDEIKVDKIFVDDVTKTCQDVALVTAIYQLTRALDKHTMVEGVETKHQYNLLRDIGFTCFQGFFFSEPGTADSIAEIIKLTNSLHSE
jgi:EAL domain-containing protein (putative c-di-GMP-specific phosphodiesterase class I)